MRCLTHKEAKNEFFRNWGFGFGKRYLFTAPFG